MNTIHRCSSRLHEASRRDKCPFGNSPAGTSRLPGRYILHILKSNIHHLPQSSMDNSLISNNTPPSDDCEALIQAAVKAVHTSTSFHAAGKQFGISPTTIPITCMVANLHPLLMKASSCSTTHRRPPSLTGANSKLTWHPRCHM